MWDRAFVLRFAMNVKLLGGNLRENVFFSEFLWYMFPTYYYYLLPKKLIGLKIEVKKVNLLSHYYNFSQILSCKNRIYWCVLVWLFYHFASYLRISTILWAKAMFKAYIIYFTREIYNSVLNVYITFPIFWHKTLQICLMKFNIPITIYLWINRHFTFYLTDVLMFWFLNR